MRMYSVRTSNLRSSISLFELVFWFFLISSFTLKVSAYYIASLNKRFYQDVQLNYNKKPQNTKAKLYQISIPYRPEGLFIEFFGEDHIERRKES